MRATQSLLRYSSFQMIAYSFENKKLIPVKVLGFHFAVGKMKTAISILFREENQAIA